MKRKYVSSIRNISIDSSVCFPTWLAVSLFFTSLTFPHAVKLNADTIALVQSSFYHYLPLSFHSMYFTSHWASFILPCRLLHATHLLPNSASCKPLIQASILSSPPRESRLRSEKLDITQDMCRVSIKTICGNWNRTVKK